MYKNIKKKYIENELSRETKMIKVDSRDYRKPEQSIDFIFYFIFETIYRFYNL